MIFCHGKISCFYTFSQKSLFIQPCLCSNLFSLENTSNKDVIRLKQKIVIRISLEASTWSDSKGLCFIGQKINERHTVIYYSNKKQSKANKLDTFIIIALHSYGIWWCIKFALFAWLPNYMKQLKSSPYQIS